MSWVIKFYSFHFVTGNNRLDMQNVINYHCKVPARQQQGQVEGIDMSGDVISVGASYSSWESK